MFISWCLVVKLIVSRGTYKGTIVAIKEIKSSMIRDSDMEEIRREALVMRYVFIDHLTSSLIPDHINVVAMIGVTSAPNPLVIVSELCENGSLYDYVMSLNSVPLSFIKFSLTGISKGEVITFFLSPLGLKHLHDNNIVHRDIAMRNILVTLGTVS